MTSKLGFKVLHTPSFSFAAYSGDPSNPEGQRRKGLDIYKGKDSSALLPQYNADRRSEKPSRSRYVGDDSSQVRIRKLLEKVSTALDDTKAAKALLVGIAAEILVDREYGTQLTNHDEAIDSIMVLLKTLPVGSPIRAHFEKVWAYRSTYVNHDGKILTLDN